MKTYPRYFISSRKKNNWAGYVVIESEGSGPIYFKNWTEKKTNHIISERQIEYHVKEGDWEEITKEELALIR